MSHNSTISITNGIKTCVSLSDSTAFAKSIASCISAKELWTSALLIETVNYLLNCINKFPQTDTFLKTLSLVLYENGSLLAPIHPLIITQCSHSLAIPDNIHSSIICLSNLCIKTGPKLVSIHALVFKSIFRFLKLHDPQEDRNIIRALKTITVLLNESKTFIQNDLLEFLELLHEFIFMKQSLKFPNQDFKVSIQAIICLSTTSRAIPKLIYPHWEKFIPVLHSKSDSLFTISRLHSALEMRTAAIEAISALLENSKQFLSIADDMSRKTSSFTSLSQKTASFIYELHSQILLTLQEQDNSIAICATIKCLTALIRNCTYEKLSNENVRNESLVAIMKYYLHRDLKVAKSCLECISALFDSKMDISDDILMGILSQATHMTGSIYSEILRVAAFETLASLIRTYPHLSVNIWKELSAPIEETITTSLDISVKAACMKCLQEYAHVSASSKTSPELISNWWIKIYPILNVQLSDTSEIIRALSLDILSNLSQDSLAAFPPKYTISLLVMILGMLQDTEASVRASSCGVLGLFVLFDLVKEDNFFILDVCNQIPQLVFDDALVVRMRASWALGNLCQTLIEMKDIELSSQIQIQIIKSGLHASRDKDKCRSNGVRILGNIFMILEPSWIQRESESTVKEMINAVLLNIDAGHVKARWNACHALAHMLKSPDLPIGNTSYTQPILKSLGNAVLNCKNFKVRIAAANALGELSIIKRFGEFRSDQISAVKGLLSIIDESLSKIDNLADSQFGEFKYQEQLKEQLEITKRTFENLLNI